MQVIKQQDINEIVKIQLLIKQMKLNHQAVDTQWVISQLRELPNFTKLAAPKLKKMIVVENNVIVGIDIIAAMLAKFERKTPAELHFLRLKMGSTVISDANSAVFERVDFSECDLTNAFSPAIVKANNGDTVNFNKVQFIECDMHEVLFKNVSLNEAKFKNTTLSATQFMYSDLANTEFESVEFSRMPRFIHSNLYHSHADTHWHKLKDKSKTYFKTALVGALLLSASVLVIALGMMNIIPLQTMSGLIGIGLFLTGTILGYVGASSSYSYRDTAKNYERFEQIIHSHAASAKPYEEWHRKVA